MGEVYRALDTRLQREVAIKMLPAAFAQDADRLRRFEQEARTTSALNHPNILTVYDIGTASTEFGGAPYIVAELLEGEELRGKLNGVVISQQTAIDYGRQIASGLAAAHSKSIVHRDLKPENLFVTNDGRVKILDFGLAKLAPKLSAGTSSEVATQAITDPGTIMGTVGYMSPEQVRGDESDHRSDIFSFGVILYEMLSGRRAFRGDSVVETMNAILKEEPADLGETNSKITPHLEKIVRRCLEKRPERRFYSAHDLGFALESLSAPSGASLTSLSEAPGAIPVTARRFNRERLGWVAAAVLFLVALALSARFYLQGAPAELRVQKLSVLPPERTMLLAGQAPLISPDGSQVAFVAIASAGTTLIYVRPLDSLTAQPLAGTEQALMPFWSPDSRSIGFFADGKLKRVEAAGGQPQTLAEAPVPRGGSWNRDGVIIFTPIPPSPTYRISASGGEATALNSVDVARGEYPRSFPQFLPDGRHYLYLSGGPQKPGSRAISVGSLDSPETKQLVTTDFSATYAPPGYLLFRREATLMAQAFDSHKLELSGDPFPVAEQVGFNGLTYQTLVSASDQGMLAYQSLGAGKTQLVWVDRGGKQFGVATVPGDYSDLSLSPNDQKVAFHQVDPETGNVDIWLMEFTGGAPSRFTFDPAVDFSPAWSSDGSKIAFASLREGVPNLFQKMASGAGQEQLLFKSPLAKLPTDWSSDGRYLLCNTVDPKTRWDLWVLSLTGESRMEIFLQTPSSELRACFAPNGRWIAYQSDESGRMEVYVQNFPATGAKWQVSTGGGTYPRFRRDGKELFYLSADRHLMAVEVKPDAAGFAYGSPKSLFETRISGKDDRPGNQYVVTSDGQRFLINNVAGEGYSPITILLNWAALHKK